MRRGRSASIHSNGQEALFRGSVEEHGPDTERSRRRCSDARPAEVARKAHQMNQELGTPKRISRRDFLRGLGAALALSSGSASPAFSMPQGAISRRAAPGSSSAPLLDEATVPRFNVWAATTGGLSAAVANLA